MIKKKLKKKKKSHPWRQNIGSHHLPRYTRYRVIAGRVIKGGDCIYNVTGVPFYQHIIITLIVILWMWVIL